MLARAVIRQAVVQVEDGSIAHRRLIAASQTLLLDDPAPSRHGLLEDLVTRIDRPEISGWLIRVLQAESMDTEERSQAFSRGKPTLSPTSMPVRDALLAWLDGTRDVGFLDIEAARQFVAKVHLRTARPLEARAVLQDNQVSLNSDPTWQWLLSRVALQLGRFDEAREAEQRALKAGWIPHEHPEPSPRADERSCQTCHPIIAERHVRSRHASTYGGVDRIEDLDWPVEPIPDPIDPKTTHHWLRTVDGVVLETRHGQQTYRATVEAVLGSGHRGQTALVRDESGRSRVARISQFHEGTLWDLTVGLPRAPSKATGYLGTVLGESERRTCIGCHVPQPRTDSTITPDPDDQPGSNGLSCQSCHGPAGHHRLALVAGLPSAGILRLTRSSSRTRWQTCASCHRAEEPLDADDPLRIRHPASALEFAACREPNGRPLDCNRCHDPHDDARIGSRSFDDACLSCHDRELHPTISSAIERIHRRRLPVQDRDYSHSCTSCHMPSTSGPILHSTYTDHRIR